MSKLPYSSPKRKRASVAWSGFDKRLNQGKILFGEYACKFCGEIKTYVGSTTHMKVFFKLNYLLFESSRESV